MKGRMSMGGYVKIIDGDIIYEAKIIKLMDNDEVMIQLLNGRHVILNSNEVIITGIGDEIK